jgi:hypothetical protein
MASFTQKCASAALGGRSRGYPDENALRQGIIQPGVSVRRNVKEMPIL